jgi:hypothetical protein
VLEVGLSEVSALEEQWKRGVSGRGVRDAFAKVEASRVPPLSKTAEGVTRPAQMFDLEGNDLWFDPGHEAIEPVSCFKTTPSLGRDGRLKQGSGVDYLSYRRGEGLCFDFAEHNGEKC